MRFIKKIFLFLASSLLVTLFLATSTLWILNNTLGDRNVVKGWFDKSGFYNNVIAEVVKATTQNAQNDPEASNIDSEVLTRVANKTFTPEFLQKNLEGALDGSYNWLEKTSPTLDFTIDLTDVTKSFGEGIGSEAKALAETLPVCSSFATQQNFDVFNADCIPSDVNLVQLANEFADGIINSQDLFPTKVIKASDIKINQNGIETPLSEAYSKVPTWYGWATSAVWVVIGLTLLDVIAIIYLSKTKSKGFFRVARSLILAVFSLVIFAVLSTYAPLSIGGVFGGDASAEGYSERVITPFITEAIGSFSSWAYKFAVIYGVLAAIILITLLVLKFRRKKNKKTDKPDIDDDKTEQTDSASDKTKDSQNEQNDKIEEKVKDSKPKKDGMHHNINNDSPTEETEPKESKKEPGKNADKKNDTDTA